LDLDGDKTIQHYQQHLLKRCPLVKFLSMIGSAFFRGIFCSLRASLLPESSPPACKGRSMSNLDYTNPLSSSIPHHLLQQWKINSAYLRAFHTRVMFNMPRYPNFAFPHSLVKKFPFENTLVAPNLQVRKWEGWGTGGTTNVSIIYRVCGQI
jgi:hypothetical protein